MPHLGCPHNCIFCDQRAISGTRSPITAEEIEKACRTASKTPHDIKNSEVAFFGGSFTAVDIETQKMCLDAAAPFVGTQFGGIRISTRPDCIDEKELEFLKNHGVASIELGAQSMFDDVLALNERGHTAAKTVEACRLIKAYGFSLGLQMMTGLYGSDDEKDIITAKKFVELKPDTVRIYPTVVLKNTKLCTLYEQQKYTPPTLESSARLCAKLLCIFRDADIKVIRLGLHSGGNVDDGYVAGVYHPAFGEICESIIFREKAEKELKDRPAGFYTVLVNTKDISKMTGQAKANIRYFAAKGYILTVKASDEMPRTGVSVTAERK